MSVGSETQGASGEPRAGAVAPRRKLSPGPGLGAQEVAAHQLARLYEATIQLVAESGYKALKVRDVVARAEVSTRAFYERFASKEDCFLQAHQLIARRATRRIIAAQAGEPDWRRRSRLIFEEFARELARDPAGARITLVEAYAAGTASLEQAWRAEGVFEGMLAESFARPPKGVVVPPLIVQGMVAGIASVSRRRLLAGRVADFASSSGELVDWALCYPSPAAAELPSLDGQTVWGDTTLERTPAAPTGDRALIVKAVVELAAARGYSGLTVPRLRSAAGVSRRKFEAHFDGVEDCYLAALEQRAGEAMAQAARAQVSARSKAGGVYRTIAALIDRTAKDPFLARICLTDDFPQTRSGMAAKERLIDAAIELWTGDPFAPRLTGLAMEASSGAAWTLFQRCLLQSREPSRIAASLVYLCLAPAIGPAATVSAIRQEQSPQGSFVQTVTQPRGIKE
jgi:AcrR family transcriptional regulator